MKVTFGNLISWRNNTFHISWQCARVYATGHSTFNETFTTVLRKGGGIGPGVPTAMATLFPRNMGGNLIIVIFIINFITYSDSQWYSAERKMSHFRQKIMAAVFRLFIFIKKCFRHICLT